jgi:hypothetical protein
MQVGTGSPRNARNALPGSQLQHLNRACLHTSLLLTSTGRGGPMWTGGFLANAKILILVSTGAPVSIRLVDTLISTAVSRFCRGLGTGLCTSLETAMSLEMNLRERERGISIRLTWYWMILISRRGCRGNEEVILWARAGFWRRIRNLFLSVQGLLEAKVCKIGESL